MEITKKEAIDVIYFYTNGTTPLGMADKFEHLITSSVKDLIERACKQLGLTKDEATRLHCDAVVARNRARGASRIE